MTAPVVQFERPGALLEGIGIPGSSVQRHVNALLLSAFAKNQSVNALKMPAALDPSLLANGDEGSAFELPRIVKYCRVQLIA